MSSFIKPVPYNQLYNVRDPAITAFQFRFRKVHAFTWTKAKWLDYPKHPLAPFTLNRYALHQNTPLWLSCIAVRETGQTDRVVRSWLARRARNAFSESLKKEGFDMEGRRLPGLGNKADMFGTAAVSVSRMAATLPYMELVKQTDVAVKYMQQYQNHSQSGQKNNGNWKGNGAAKGRKSVVTRQKQDEKVQRVRVTYH